MRALTRRLLPVAALALGASGCSPAKPAGGAPVEAPAPAPAPPPTEAQAAQAAAAEWLALADRGDWARCYETAAAVVRGKTDRAAFVKALASGHADTGKVESRTLDRAHLVTDPPGHPAGLYAELTYSARYESMAEAVDKVTLAKDADGRWRVAGYWVERPSCKPTPPGPSSLPAPPAALGLDPFYAKYLVAAGIPVVSSAAVSDRALFAAATIVRRMLRKRPDVRDRLVAEGVRLAVMSPVEQTLDLPEQREMQDEPTDTPGVGWNERARGLGGSFAIPVVSAGEENLLCLPCDRYRGGSVLVHELGHTIEVLGLGRDAAFQRDLVAAYDSALAAGKWRGTYAGSNRHEYWAVGVQSWFGANEPWERRSRAELAAYDPGLYALLERVFVEDDWRPTCGAVEPADDERPAQPGPALPAPRACPRAMVPVAGGRFPMGADESVQPFCMDATEVTVGAYAACVRAGRCTPAGSTVRVIGPPAEMQAKWSAQCNGSRADRRDHPVNCVDWTQAAAYCRAQGKRLPTEQEWEWAARGGPRAWAYPWGNTAPQAQLCWSGSGNEGSSCEVGRFPAGDTPEGIHDLAGNVWEWTASAGQDAGRVHKGGGWDATRASAVRATAHDEGDPDVRLHNTGFRCVK